VRRSTDQYPDSLTSGTGVFWGLSSSFKDTQIVPGETYFYSVFAQYTRDRVSSCVTINPTAQNRAPGTVSGVSATFENNKISLSWSNPSEGDLASIRVRRSTIAYTNSLTEGTPVGGAEGIKSAVEDTSVSGETTYYYSVFAIDHGGNVSSAAQVKITTPKKYSIHYNVNGGTGVVESGALYWEGDAVTLGEGAGLTKDGFSFQGWSTKNNGAGAYYESNQVIVQGNEDIGLYAIWIVEGLEFKKTGSTYEVSGFTGDASIVEIPRQFKGIEVTRIGSGSFSGRDVRNVLLPDSITSIGDSAFKACRSLRHIVIPDSVTEIGASAFKSCSGLDSISIPEGVTRIANSTFEDCVYLGSISLPDTLESIGRRAFESCYSLETLISLNAVPPSLAHHLNYLNRLNKIKVPAGSVTAYKNALGWADKANLIVALP
jgi:hypothetical protein